ncbi:HVO_A0114 family putative DNA-binding protein [Pararhizobium sp.]|uniref:HVO_A0114 family putative DNA-binding protein n=1 Tax=Pararhizobium sp. TaxID=1977563 RepID=UPI0027270BAF|nr:transcriptional regulator [Pararhizobium sp.]MDO9417272.1 transcriptional regulator [Pararhizobium sp.]
MDDSAMKTVTIGVSSLEDTKRQMAAAFRGEAQGAHLSFASVDLLWKVLTPKRWELLQALSGKGAMSLREAARRAGRDVKAVHGDVHALLDAGVLERTEDGRILFPYDAIHVDFTLRAA